MMPLIHGVLIADPSLARRLYQRAQLDNLRTAARTDDAALYAFIRDLYALAYAPVTETRKNAEAATNSKESYTPAEARQILHIGEHAIRLALREHRLKGDKNNGRWTISTQALNDYRRTRTS